MPLFRRPHAASLPFSSTSRLSDAAQQIPDRTDVFEAHPERGLRMLMFGKPGSGKVTLLLQFGGVSVTGTTIDRRKAHTLHIEFQD
jgi:ABC-type lipoprotein export system ATPase subunit